MICIIQPHRATVSGEKIDRPAVLLVRIFVLYPMGCPRQGHDLAPIAQRDPGFGKAPVQDVQPRIGERRDLPPPAVPKFGESVQDGERSIRRPGGRRSKRVSRRTAWCS